MTQFEKDLILEIIKTVGLGGLAYIFRVVLKIVQNVSSIPKIKADLDNVYSRLRSLEEKNDKRN